MKNEVINAILPLTAQFEGFRANVYKCPAGFDTIGYGRNIEANPLKPDEKAKLNADGSVSEAVAKEWLREYLDKCYTELEKSFSWFGSLDLPRQAALVDLDYNMGLNTLKGFKNTLKAFENKDFAAAANGLESSKWYKQVKTRGIKIVSIVREGKIA